MTADEWKGLSDIFCEVVKGTTAMKFNKTCKVASREQKAESTEGGSRLEVGSRE